MKLEEDTDSLKFTVNILGHEKFGSTIFVRDAYKDLYNIIVWARLIVPNLLAPTNGPTLLWVPQVINSKSFHS